MKSRSYVFTYNNPPFAPTDNNSLVAWLNQFQCKYAIAGHEVAPLTGTPHLQGYLQFKNPRGFAAVRKLLPGCHIEPAKGTPLQSRTYCSKEGNFAEVGDIPQDSGDREKQRWDDARQMAKEGKFDAIPSDIYIRYLGNLHRIFRETLPPVDPLPNTCGLWLLGATGSGKSRGVRAHFPLLYPKPMNKWWDGYQDHDHVLLDDVDHNQSAWLGNFLKIWADHYPFIAEKKGGSMLIRPKHLIVTSQYTIEEIFSDVELRAALNRRFTLINVYTNKDIIWP